MVTVMVEELLSIEFFDKVVHHPSFAERYH